MLTTLFAALGAFVAALLALSAAAAIGFLLVLRAFVRRLRRQDERRRAGLCIICGQSVQPPASYCEECDDARQY